MLVHLLLRVKPILYVYIYINFLTSTPKIHPNQTAPLIYIPTLPYCTYTCLNYYICVHKYNFGFIRIVNIVSRIWAGISKGRASKFCTGPSRKDQLNKLRNPINTEYIFRFIKDNMKLGQNNQAFTWTRKLKNKIYSRIII